jgi:midasin
MGILDVSLKQNVLEGITMSVFDEILKESTSSHIHSLFSSYVLPCIAHLKSFCSSSLKQDYGAAVVNLSQGYLSAMIQDDLVDPSEYFESKLALIQLNLEHLSSSIILETEFELWKTGHETNANILRLHEQLKSFELKHKHISSNLSFRPTRSQVMDILAEMQSLKNIVLGKNSGVSQWISSFDCEWDESMILREKHIQDNLTACIERLEGKFAAYLDIIMPINLSLYHLKYGLRLLRLSKTVDSDTHQTLVGDCMNFISDQDPKVLVENCLQISVSSNNTPEESEYIVKSAICSLERIRAHARIYGHITKEQLEIAQTMFHRLSMVYSSLQELRIQKEQEEANLFKYKASENVIDTEDEIDEKEFAKLFPDFSAEYEKPEALNHSQKSFGISDSDALKIFYLHQDISFLSFNCNSEKRSENADLLQKSFNSSYKFASQLLVTQNISVSNEIDDRTKSGHLRMARFSLQDIFERSESSLGVLYDVYNDPNLEEAKKLFSVIKSFDKRLEALLEKWPDHVVLNHLSAICRKIVSNSVGVSIMKLLNGVEFLLQKSQDWEAYASREVSLRDELAALSQCIIHLRKLELTSWNDLLAIQKRKCIVNASKFWFHTWQIIFTPLTSESSKVNS